MGGRGERRNRTPRPSERRHKPLRVIAFHPTQQPQATVVHSDRVRRVPCEQTDKIGIKLRAGEQSQQAQGGFRFMGSTVPMGRNERVERIRDGQYSSP